MASRQTAKAPVGNAAKATDSQRRSGARRAFAPRRLEGGSPAIGDPATQSM
jgi:hypothetical protein